MVGAAFLHSGDSLDSVFLHSAQGVELITQFKHTWNLLLYHRWVHASSPPLYRSHRMLWWWVRGNWNCSAKAKNLRVPHAWRSSWCANHQHWMTWWKQAVSEVPLARSDSGVKNTRVTDKACHNLQVLWSHCWTLVTSKADGRRTFEVNMRAMQAIKTIGKGSTALMDLRSIINVLHCGLHKTFQMHLNETFQERASEAAQNMFSNAVDAVCELYKKTDLAFNRNITVVYDGTWLTHRHTSYMSIGTITEFHSGLVTDSAVLPSYWHGAHSDQRGMMMSTVDEKSSTSAKQMLTWIQGEWKSRQDCWCSGIH